VLDERRRKWFAAFGASMMGGGAGGIPDEVAKLDIFSVVGSIPWTKDPAATFITIVLMAPGAGGASGGRGASSILGGGGGCGGSVHFYAFDAAFLGATGTVVIPAGGAGGLGRATDGAGLIGSAGGDTSFTDSNGFTFAVPSGTPGTPTAGGTPPTGLYNLGPGNGGTPSIAGVGKGGGPSLAPGGCAGGSLTAGAVAGAGGDITRVAGFMSLYATILGGAGSAVGNGAPGGAGFQATAIVLLPSFANFNSGAGGGGASSFAGGNGGAGADGPFPGGGGGGGGACISGTSGKGGDGSRGYACIVQFL
jgi:hypothetical protein